jgi:copper transport protein
VLLWAVVLGALLVTTPVSALAHAVLVSSTPADGAILTLPPQHLTLRFNQAVQPAGPGIGVTAPSGRPANRGQARASGSLLTVDLEAREQGTYLVRWQVIAQDTHPSLGQLTFSVGRRSPVGSAATPAGEGPGELLQALGRWLHFLGLALGFGSIAYGVVVLGEANAVQRRSLDRLAVSGVVLMLVAEPVTLAGASLALSVAPGDLVVSTFGFAASLRLGGALLLWSALGALSAAGEGRRATSLKGILALGAAVLLADQLAGHRLADAPALAGVVLESMHEGTAVVWAGGIAGWLVTRAGGARFVRVAALTLAVLVPSGVALAFAHLRSPADLLSTSYGEVLSVKVVVVGAALALAALGARRAEALVVAAVLALAALLMNLPPPV